VERQSLSLGQNGQSAKLTGNFLIMPGLFNDDFNSPDYIAQNTRMISE